MSDPLDFSDLVDMPVKDVSANNTKPVENDPTDYSDLKDDNASLQQPVKGTGKALTPSTNDVAQFVAGESGANAAPDLEHVRTPGLAASEVALGLVAPMALVSAPWSAIGTGIGTLVGSAFRGAAMNYGAGLFDDTFGGHYGQHVAHFLTHIGSGPENDSN